MAIERKSKLLDAKQKRIEVAAKAELMRSIEQQRAELEEMEKTTEGTIATLSLLPHFARQLRKRLANRNQPRVGSKRKSDDAADDHEAPDDRGADAADADFDDDVMENDDNFENTDAACKTCIYHANVCRIFSNISELAMFDRSGPARRSRVAAVASRRRSERDA